MKYYIKFIFPKIKIKGPLFRGPFYLSYAEFHFFFFINNTNFCKIFAYNTSLLYIRSDILSFFPSTNFFVLVNYMKEMRKCVHFLHTYKSFIPLFASSKTPTLKSGGSSMYLTNCPLNIMLLTSSSKL